MTKKPKVDYAGAMGSELRDSAFFRREQGSQAPADTQSEPDESSVAAFVGRRQPREEKVGPERANARTSERAIVRQSYEIFKDQHAALREFSIEEMQRGERGSMSEMVREALDAYITKRKRQRA